MIVILTQRQKKILLYLLEQLDYITMSVLASQFLVSEKSIRNDLITIDDYLRSRGLVLTKIPSKGCVLNLSDADKKRLIEGLSGTEDYVYSKQRRLEMSSVMLICKGKITYQEIADIVMVNKLTVMRDMQMLIEQFRLHNLDLMGKAGQGLMVTGDEIKRRNYLMDICKDSVTDDEWIMPLLTKLGFEDEVKKAELILQEIANEVGVVYFDSKVLIVVISCCILRMKQGYFVDQGGVPMEITDSHEYMATKEALSKYGIDNRHESGFIASVLLEAKIQNQQTKNGHYDDIEVADMADYIIREIRVAFNFPEVMDEMNTYNQLFDALYFHLKVAIFRMKKKIPIKNELLEKIQVTIPLIYELTKNIIAKCEERYNLKFGQEEASFIAMYIATIYEIKVRAKYNIKILVVCNFGLSTSNLLKSKLLKLLPSCEIIGPMSTIEGEEYLRENSVDLVITTTNLSISWQKIVVNPLLFDDDIEKINAALSQKYYEKQCSFFIEAYTNQNTLQETVLLRDIVKLQDIQIIQRCNDWESAVYATAQPLIARGDLEERYVEKIISTVKRLGNYMILLPEIAFIHASTQDGINRTCTSVLVLKEPVMFGVKKHQFVRCIVLLGIKDSDDTSLLKLISIFENIDNRVALQNCTLSVDTVYNMHT